MNWKNRSRLIYLFLGLIIADQLCKILILKLYPVWVQKNPGIVFGIFSSQFGLIIWLVLIGLILFIILVSRSQKRSSNLFWWAITLVLAGGISNFIDRLWHGYVIDFLSFWLLPVFNLADMMIVVGCGLLVYQSIKSEKSKLEDGET